MITVDLNPQSEKHNAKQREFFDFVMREVSNSQRFELLKKKISDFPTDGNPDELGRMEVEFMDLEQIVSNGYRYFCYGGAVSGGKTIITLLILCVLCKMYPGSRWHVVRKSTPDLERTANESLSFILRGSENVRWRRTKSDYFAEFGNGSRIYFMAESYDRDKDLNRFKGLMTNGFLLEQVEELQHKTFDKAIERAGRWYGVKGVMPPPIILMTFNPTFGWIKKKIHDQHKAEKLKTPYYYLQALPDDNPWNTDEQWRSWENMDPETYARFIKGEWDIKIENQFFHQFSGRNVAPVSVDWREDVWLSFDFNVDPMTCIVGQSDGRSFVRVLHEFRTPNSDTYDLCEKIRPLIYGREHLVKITGDASGKNRMSGARQHINQYEIIRNELNLSLDQFFVPSANPTISDSRSFMNSLLYRLPEFHVDPSCEHLIQDLKFLETDIDRSGHIGIKKSGVNNSLQIDNAMIGHLADCLRYFCHATMYEWIKMR